MQKIEHQTAVAFVKWWDMTARQMGVSEVCLHAIPNGGARNIITGKMLKDEGVRAGVSDYFLALPRGGKHGLYLELKAGGPGVRKCYATREQLDFGAVVQDNGYEFVVARGLEEAVHAVSRYLNHPI